MTPTDPIIERCLSSQESYKQLSQEFILHSLISSVSVFLVPYSIKPPSFLPDSTIMRPYWVFMPPLCSVTSRNTTWSCFSSLLLSICIYGEEKVFLLVQSQENWWSNSYIISLFFYRGFIFFALYWFLTSWTSCTCTYFVLLPSNCLDIPGITVVSKERVHVPAFLTYCFGIYYRLELAACWNLCWSLTSFILLKKWI